MLLVQALRRKLRQEDSQFKVSVDNTGGLYVVTYKPIIKTNLSLGYISD
jgi:hypothetical protein